MEALRTGVVIELRAHSKGIEADLAALKQQCGHDCQHHSVTYTGSHLAAHSGRPGSAVASADGADSLFLRDDQLASCDGILATMEGMLTHCQADLSAISGEIQTRRRSHTARSLAVAAASSMLPCRWPQRKCHCWARSTAAGRN